jgi:hypothetical protein
MFFCSLTKMNQRQTWRLNTDKKKAPQMAMPWRPLQMRWVRDPRFYDVNTG